ncbi:3137_t:CDS:1, partial [Funneliformis geosporum]
VKEIFPTREINVNDIEGRDDKIIIYQVFMENEREALEIN